MNEQRKKDRSNIKEASRRIKVILREHMEGKPVLRDMVARILSREREREQARIRSILGN